MLSESGFGARTLSESGFSGLKDFQDNRRRADSCCVVERTDRNEPIISDALILSESGFGGRTLSESGFSGLKDCQDNRRRADSCCVVERTDRNEPIISDTLMLSESGFWGRTLSESGFSGLKDCQDNRRRADSCCVVERADRNDPIISDALMLSESGFWGFGDSRDGGRWIGCQGWLAIVGTVVHVIGTVGGFGVDRGLRTGVRGQVVSVQPVFQSGCDVSTPVGSEARASTTRRATGEVGWRGVWCGGAGDVTNFVTKMSQRWREFRNARMRGHILSNVYSRV